MKFLKKEKGFTLIELLVVVAIIGVLATIVLSSLGEARNRAKDAKIRSILSQIKTQAEIQYLDTGDYSTICDIGTKTYQMFLDAHNTGGPLVGSNSGDGSNVCVDINELYYGVSKQPFNHITGGGSSGGWLGAEPSGSTWAVTVRLNSNNNWFCVDSLGNSIEAGPTRPINADKDCA